jgi:hypothetical protein
MRRGWEVEYPDGMVLDEENNKWKDISKNNITRLTLRYDGREWNILNKKNYFQKKRGWSVPGSKVIYIMSRSVGYYDEDERCKVWYTVEEDTGRMTMEITNG